MKYSLENVNVDKPCSADWNEMNGKGNTRLCHRCKINIHNISEMSERRALKVLNQTEDRVCISFYRNEQNKIVTQNYFSSFKRLLLKTVATIIAAILSFTSVYALQTSNHKLKKSILHSKHLKKVLKHRKKRQHKNIKIPRLVVGKRVIGIRITDKDF